MLEKKLTMEIKYNKQKKKQGMQTNKAKHLFFINTYA